ncbi:MAG: aspartate aminotransferase family protein [Acidimicrobiales bacterium]
MGFDLHSLLEDHKGENFDRYARCINPQLVRVLSSIGFDRQYVRADGAYLYDADGNRYLDFLAGFGVFGLGRGHPVIKKALHEAIDADLPNLVQMDAPLLAGVLAEELLGRLHRGLGRIFFTNSGAEAVEAALKFARCATGRDGVVHADHAFHGLTYGALSLNGGREFRKGFGSLLPGNTEVGFGDVEALERALRRRDIAAFVIEVIQGKGVNLAPQEYWDAVGELCRKYETLLVVDEVQTGLGRTGNLWAYEHYGLTPDIVTMSKALSGGFVPVGAMACSTAVSDKVYSSMQRALVHSSTFKNNQLAMVAGLATLKTIDDEQLVDRARLTGIEFEKALAPLIERHESFLSVRGKGLMIGLVFGEPKSLGQRTRFKLLEAAHTGLYSQIIVGPLFARHRILTQVAADQMNVVKLLPPLTIGQEEVDYFTEALDDVLTDAEKGSSLIFDFGRSLIKGARRRSN